MDETGQVLSGGDLLAVVRPAGRARAQPGAQVAVPVTAPSAIERIMAEHGGGVTRTKTDVRVPDGARRRKARKASRWPATATAALSSRSSTRRSTACSRSPNCWKCWRCRKRRSAQVRAVLPQYYMASETVPCPWEVKGRIMRVLTDGNRRTSARNWWTASRLYKRRRRLGAGPAGRLRAVLPRLRRSAHPGRGQRDGPPLRPAHRRAQGVGSVLAPASMTLPCSGGGFSCYTRANAPTGSSRK